MTQTIYPHDREGKEEGWKVYLTQALRRSFAGTTLYLTIAIGCWALIDAPELMILRAIPDPRIALLPLATIGWVTFALLYSSKQTMHIRNSRLVEFVHFCAPMMPKSASDRGKCVLLKIGIFVLAAAFFCACSMLTAYFCVPATPALPPLATILRILYFVPAMWWIAEILHTLGLVHRYGQYYLLSFQCYQRASGSSAS